jgi:hypothetical protein
MSHAGERFSLIDLTRIFGLSVHEYRPIATQHLPAQQAASKVKGRMRAPKKRRTLQFEFHSTQGAKLLRPLNVAEGYLRLFRMGFDAAEIAVRVGKTKTFVEQLLDLANANADVHALVRDGRVAVDAAIEAVRRHGEKAGEMLYEQLENHQLDFEVDPTETVPMDLTADDKAAVARASWHYTFDWETYGDLFETAVETGTIIKFVRRTPGTKFGQFEIVAKLTQRRLIEPNRKPLPPEAPMPWDLRDEAVRARRSNRKVRADEVAP